MTPHDRNLCRFLFCEMLCDAGARGLKRGSVGDIFDMGVDGANQRTDDAEDDAMAEAFKAAVERYLREREAEPVAEIAPAERAAREEALRKSPLWSADPSPMGRVEVKVASTRPEPPSGPKSVLVLSPASEGNAPGATLSLSTVGGEAPPTYLRVAFAGEPVPPGHSVLRLKKP